MAEAEAAEEARLQELKKLKLYFDQGFLAKEEYDARRLALIDGSLTVPSNAAPAKVMN